MPDGSSALPTPLAFADKETALRRAFAEKADLICVECQCDADELREDLCADCFENSIDTSWPAMRAEHGTW